MSRSAPRSASRQLALQVLYAADLAELRSGAPVDVASIFDDVAENFDLPGGARAFAEELAMGVERMRGSLDAHIARCASNWRIDRMAAVDRNVLRLAAFELVRGEVPESVVIDQAIELARRFGGDPSPAFVNGVLDAVARELKVECVPAHVPGEPGGRGQETT